MTNSDQLMLSAIKAGVPFRINGREVTVENNGLATVRLHGEIIATLSFQSRTVIIYGRTPVSRKSARVFNSLLKAFTDCSIQSMEGQWVISGYSASAEPLGTREITLPMKKVIFEQKKVPTLVSTTHE